MIGEDIVAYGTGEFEVLVDFYEARAMLMRKCSLLSLTDRTNPFRFYLKNKKHVCFSEVLEDIGKNHADRFPDFVILNKIIDCH